MATRDKMRIAEYVLDECVNFLNEHALEQALNVSTEYAKVTQGNAQLLDTCVRMKLEEIVEGAL